VKVNEVLAEDKLASPARLLTLLQQNCKPFLSQAGWNDILWRGVSDSLPSVSIQTNRPGRRPVTTNKAISKAADDWFLEHTGVRYRSNSVFTSGNPSHSASYGEVYAVFPIGDFKFCWSPIVEDMFMMVSDLQPHVDRNATELPPYVKLEIEKRLSEAEYKTDDLIAATGSNSETMLHCGKYYMLDKDTFIAVRAIALGKK
jgi:hypothetical protein